MSGAKDRMRHKKMRNQPSSVTGSAEWTGGRGTDTPQRGHGQSGAWARGHQTGAPPEQTIPKYLTASFFARARATEVDAMLRAVSKTTGSCHVFGALPKHMRRRAMSHNTKRLPCRLREVAHRMLEKSQKAGQKEKKEQSKTKSRRARRRHGNLLLEFNRRQRKSKWLETHIWHAKRFHMLKTWGYCLGDRPTYKCYRNSYRAMSTSCLLQDLSYYCCIELQGPEEQLLSALSRLTSKDTGPTFRAALCLSGQREGRVMLYRPDQHPYQPLGPARFLWKPCNTELPLRQLWIWVHPILMQDLLPELQTVCQCFDAVAPDAETVPSEPPARQDHTSNLSSTPASSLSSDLQLSGKKRKREEDSNSGHPSKKILGDGTRSPMTPASWKSSKTGIVIRDLTMEIVRYRLIGPLSHIVLTETLLPATEVEDDIKSAASPFWWPEHCKNKDSMILHQQQADMFHLLRGVYSTAELPAGCVLGLTVDDPRLTLPKKCEKVMAVVQAGQGEDEERKRDLTLKGFPAPCAHSSLWNQSVRDSVTNSKISEQDVNRMKRDVLVPGSRLATPPQGRVPLLLLHQPGKQQGQEHSGWGSGWDLLLPKGWAMAFWVPLVYRGVRVGGLQMSMKHSQNKGMPHFPNDYPDCPAGVRFQEQLEAELLEKFKRRPPSKRTNYIKHGCLAPFRCPWPQLAEEWEEIVKQENEGNAETVRKEGVMSLSGKGATSTACTVLRSRKILKQLSVWCLPFSAHAQRVQRACSAPSLRPEVAMTVHAEWRRCLVWVRVCVLGKGRPLLHSMLCVPTAEDLLCLRRDPRYSGPKEPQHRDHFQHLLKKRVGKKRKAPPAGTESSEREDSFSKTIKGESNPTTMKEQDIKDPPSSPVIKSTCEVIGSNWCEALVQGLWPEPLPSVSSNCSRLTLGWVTHGDFSLAAGAGEALGFVSLAGLLHTLLQQPADQRGTVLLRNPSSLQYRYARLHIEA